MKTFRNQTNLPILAALSAVMVNGGRGADLVIQSRLRKDRNCLNMMKMAWRFSIFSTRTKLKPQRCPRNSPARFEMLAIDRDGFNEPIHITP